LSKSIAIEPELLELLQKVAGVWFFLRHSVDHISHLENKSLSVFCNIVTMYWLFMKQLA